MDRHARPGFRMESLQWILHSFSRNRCKTSKYDWIWHRHRFVWNGTTLTQAQNLIRLRALQTDNIATTNHHHKLASHFVVFEMGEYF